MNPDIAKESVQFSSENQPSTEARSEGQKKWHDRRKLKDDLMAEFAKPLRNESTGEQKDTFEEGILLCKKAMFHSKSKLTEKEKTELFLKVCDFVGVAEKSLEIKGGLDITPKIIKDDIPDVSEQ